MGFSTLGRGSRRAPTPPRDLQGWIGAAKVARGAAMSSRGGSDARSRASGVCHAESCQGPLPSKIGRSHGKSGATSSATSFAWEVGTIYSTWRWTRDGSGEPPGTTLHVKRRAP